MRRSTIDKNKTVASDKVNGEKQVQRAKDKWHGLPEKQFALRESLITTLFENPHLKTIHHIFIAFFIGLFLSTICQDYVEYKEVDLGLRLIVKGFGKFHIALAGWVSYCFFTLIAYFGFKIWANVRTVLGSKKKSLKKLWDVFAGLVLLSFYIFCFRLAVYIVSSFELPPASAAFILLEQTRLLMKIHAFVRSNIPKVLNYKDKNDNKLILPTVKYFIYFMAVPTLVYRDEYPRTSYINWRRVASYGLEIIAVILFYSFSINKYFIPAYHEYGIRKFTYTEMLLKTIDTSIAATLLFLSTFYLVLHLMQNFFAEILKFGDRMFYKDWWTATDFTTYYRTWNVLVHDWLYTYIYKDCYEILLPKNKMFAKYATFLISAVVHEWVMMHMLGYMFPLMFFMFFFLGTFVTCMNPPKNSLLNILFWVSISYGISILMCGYMLEYFARYNNVQPINKELDFYIPRSLTCDCYQ
ncbi:hypothetical protein WA026_022535 [Henosepilachna vigintioctopunctata]|uniref:O-acyltransferase n=1 Tax=Henosepilachna vigintioctopunctata TaxID=420089 RepID=A0AAW1VHZ3_9CUCU